MQREVIDLFTGWGVTQYGDEFEHEEFNGRSTEFFMLRNDLSGVRLVAKLLLLAGW